MKINDPDYWDLKFKEYKERGISRIDLPGFDLIAGKIKEGDTVLDFGCGTGDFLKHISNIPGIRLYGCDISRFAALDALKKLPDLAWYDNITIFNDYFDVITCIHVLEHFEDPVKCITDLKKALKPDGWLIVVLPFHDRYWLEHHKIWGKIEVEELFSHFDCDVETMVRNSTELGKHGKIFIKQYRDGALFEEVICFVKFHNP